MKQKQHFLIDMHTHLNEKKISAKKYWNCVKNKGLSAIAITEHIEYDCESAYKKLKATKPKEIILIPGMEAKTTAGHLLVFGADEKLYEVKELQQKYIPIEKALQIAKENNFVASFAHPYGYKLDSATNTLGEQKTKQLMKKYSSGSEYYNGMLGSANDLVFGTQWIKKLYNFFDFMEKSKAGKALLITQKSATIKKKLEKLSEETLNRVKKGVILSQSASFITVGSDAHYPQTIGTAVIELKRKPKNEKDVLKMVKEKKVLWAGPNIYLKNPVKHLKKKELLEGLKYITKKKLQGKVTKLKN